MLNYNFSKLTKEQQHRITVCFNENKLTETDLSILASLANQLDRESIVKSIDRILISKYIQPLRLRFYTDDDYNYLTSDPKADTVLDHVYFHGGAEEILGHDIICVPSDDHITDGIHYFEVRDRTHDHQVMTGVVFIWIDKYNLRRGLAVLEADHEALEYALECLLSGKSSL